MTEEAKPKKMHISFSELKDWYICPTYHNLKWIKELIKFSSNEYTLTGTAVHSACEKLLTEEYNKRKNNEQYVFDNEETVKYYKKCFVEQMNKYKEENPEAYSNLNRKNTMKVVEQCSGLFVNILSEMKSQFGNYKVIKCEHQLYQPIEGVDYNFKGFIDLIIQLENGRYVIIDWKTASYWDLKKKTSKETTYQLTFYKHYYSKEMNIDPKLIDCYFILLKRTAKTNNVEFVPVTCGSRKIENALEYLNKAVSSILQNKIEQNRHHCSECECYMKHCLGVTNGKTNKGSNIS